MVRILKVSHLEERKKLLLTRSEMYRQTLSLEFANINYSVALWKRKLGIAKSALQVAGVVAPVVGLFFAVKRAIKNPSGSGLLSKFASGLKIVGGLRPILRGFAAATRMARGTQGENGE